MRLFGDIDTVLARFYDDAIDAARASAKEKEGRLRERLEEGFITPLGTRSTVFQGRGKAAGIPDEAIAELENRHLIRAEVRAGARWYELTHDRLIEPIRASNRRRLAELRRRRNRRGLAALASVAGLLALMLSLALWRLGDEEAAPPRLIDLGALKAKPAATLQPGEGTFTAAAFSPNGTLVVTASDDETARVWNATTGRRLAVFDRHEEEVWSADFSPDGERVVTASADETARVWEARTGREVAVLHFGPEGNTVVTAEFDGIARVWEPATGKVVILSGNTEDVADAALSPDGKYVVTRAAPICVPSQDGMRRRRLRDTQEPWSGSSPQARAERIGHP